MATTVTPAATASFQLGPFDTLTLSSSGARGSIVLTSQAPKLCADQTLSPQNGTFGPWGAPMSVVMTITQGSCDYAVNVRSLTVDQAQALVSGAGVAYASTSALSAAVQASGAAAIAAGTTLLDETLLLGSNTNLTFQPGTLINSTGTTQHTMIRTGNAEFQAAGGAMPGVSIYCADEVTASGEGSLRYTHSGTTLAWRAPGDASYGAEVSIASVVSVSTIGIFAVTSSGGHTIYVYAAPGRSGNATRTVRVESVTGARPVTWTRIGGTRNVVEANHRRRAGDFIIHFGPSGDVSHGFIRSVTPTSYTFADPGADQATPQIGRAYGVRNIRITGNGAVLDYRKGSLATAAMSNLHAVVFNACSDCSIDDIQVNNCTKYGLLVTGFKNFRVEGFQGYRDDSTDLSGNSDVVHPLGPGRGFRAVGVRAQGGDNLLGVGCADIYDYVLNVPAYGDLSLIDGYAQDLRGEESDEQLVRFYGATGSNVIKNWTVDGIYGTYNADAAVSIITDAMSGQMVDYGDTNIDGLTIISPDAVRADGTASFAFVNRGSGTRRGIKLLKVRPRAGTSAYRGTVWLDNAGVEDIHVEFTAGSFSGYLLGGTGALGVGKATLRSTGKLIADNGLGGGMRPVIVAMDSSTTNMTVIDAAGLWIDDVSTSGTKVALLFSNGAYSEASFTDIRMEDGDALVRGTGSATGGGIVRATRCYLNTDFGVTFDGGMPGTISLEDVWHASGANQMVGNNDATVRTTRVYARNVRCGNRFLRNIQGNHTWLLQTQGVEVGAGLALVTSGGTPNWRIDGQTDLVIDGALLDATVANHKAGASFYNTNAAFGSGVGAQVRGAAAWVRTAA